MSAAAQRAVLLIEPRTWRQAVPSEAATAPILTKLELIFPILHRSIVRLLESGTLALFDATNDTTIPLYTVVIIPLLPTTRAADVIDLWMQEPPAYPKTTFLIVWHADAVTDPFLRQQFEFLKMNAIVHTEAGLMDVVAEVQRCAPSTTLPSSPGANVLTSSWRPSSVSSASSRHEIDLRVSCPYCGMLDLSPLAFCYHIPTYHINEPNERKGKTTTVACPLCNNNHPIPRFQVHVHEDHLCALTNAPREQHTGDFALVCCCTRVGSERRWLLVQEFGLSGLWLPGGQLNPGESLLEGVKRECIEEGGVNVHVTGFVEVVIKKNRRWRRVIFVGSPADNSDASVIPACKVVPDFESFGACWVTLHQLRANNLRFRGQSEVSWIAHIEENPSCVRPLSELDRYFDRDSPLLRDT